MKEGGHKSGNNQPGTKDKRFQLQEGHVQDRAVIRLVDPTMFTGCNLQGPAEHHVRWGRGEERPLSSPHQTS